MTYGVLAGKNYCMSCLNANFKFNEEGQARQSNGNGSVSEFQVISILNFTLTAHLVSVSLVHISVDQK